MSENGASGSSFIPRSSAVLAAGVVGAFNCLGDKCEDTCCRAWSMQLDDDTYAKYQREAPELLDSVAEDEGGLRVMKRDAQTGCCVRLEGGLCGIHRAYGADMLGDACYFYPRVARALGGQTVMTATLSCPEIARLALNDDRPAYVPAEAPRLPRMVKDYLPEGISTAQALAVHDAFLEAAGKPGGMIHIASVARSLEKLTLAQWDQAAPFFLDTAEARLASPQPQEVDPFNLLHALCGLVVASRKAGSPRLRETARAMEDVLAVTLDWQSAALGMEAKKAPRFIEARKHWHDAHAESFAPFFARWLKAQLSVALFPFSGLGSAPFERAAIIGVRYATVKLALMCHAFLHPGCTPGDEDSIRIVQSIARVLDHLGDAGYSLQVYHEAGWLSEGRLRAIVEL